MMGFENRRQIELEEPTADLLHELGGTFDSPNDIVRRGLERLKADEENIDRWTETRFQEFLDGTKADKQEELLRTLITYEEEWVPLEYIVEHLQNEGHAVDGSAVGGILGGLSRKVGDKPKLWETRENGGREYRIIDNPPFIRRMLKEHFRT